MIKSLVKVTPPVIVVTTLNVTVLAELTENLMSVQGYVQSASYGGSKLAASGNAEPSIITSVTKFDMTSHPGVLTVGFSNT